MKLLIHIATALAAATITSTSVVKTPSIQSSDGNFELLILHNNDMHARFEQTSQMSGTCTTADREAGKCYGGFPRVAHVVKEARRAAATGEGPPVLYLNAGDTYTGTAWFTIYKWKIAAEFINALEPDAVSLGSNELERRSSLLSPLLENLNTKILATNVIVKGQEDKLQKSIIFDIQGTKVGLVGYLTPDSDILDSAGNIEYIDEVIALKEEVAKLQALNVNIIIALGHANTDKDMEIAREVEGLDLVIAGHKNIFSWTGTSAEDQQVDKAIEVTQKSGKRVPVIQSYAYNNFFGKFHAKFDATGDIAQYYVEPIHLDTTIPQDSEAVQRINNLRANIESKSNEILGQTAVVLEGESCKTEECNLGNLIVDAINYYHALRFEGERWTDAPIAIIPGGHIAGSIAPNNRPADVTLGDLLAAIPIESRLVTVTMSGTILNQVLEHAISTYSVSNPTGQLLQFSGIRVVYDLSRESGSRLVSAVARCWSCFVPEFYTIDDWRTYPVIMPESLANGEYGYTMLTELPRTNLAYDEVTCTAEFIRLRSPVYPEVAGRIEFMNYNPEPDMTDTTTTEAVTTEVPTTEALTTEDPATEDPATEDPATEDPATEDPTTEAPTNEDPTTVAPITTLEPDSAVAISSTLTVLMLTLIPFMLS